MVQSACERLGSVYDSSCPAIVDGCHRRQDSSKLQLAGLSYPNCFSERLPKVPALLPTLGFRFRLRPWPPTTCGQARAKNWPVAGPLASTDTSEVNMASWPYSWRLQERHGQLKLVSGTLGAMSEYQHWSECIAASTGPTKSLKR